MYVYVVMVGMWRTESCSSHFFSSNMRAPGIELWFGGKHLYPLSYLTSPTLLFKCIIVKLH